MLMRTYVAFAGLWFFSLAAHSASFWPVEDLKRIEATVTLRTKDGPVAEVSGRSIAALMGAKARVQAVANIYPVLLITDRPGINATAAPSPKGPIIAVTIEMLRAVGEDADQWAALIGHELAHLTHKHSAPKQGPEPKSWTYPALIDAIVARSYSRENEREADATGLRYAVEAGFDPDGAVALQRTLLAHLGGQGEFLDTHPSSEKRIASLSIQITTSYARARGQKRPASDPALTVAEGHRWQTVCVTEATQQGLTGASADQHAFACMDEKAPLFMRLLTFCGMEAREKKITDPTARLAYMQACVQPAKLNGSAPGDYWLTYCVNKTLLASPQGPGVRRTTWEQCLTSASPELMQAFEECNKSLQDSLRNENLSAMSACMRENVPPESARK